MNIRVARGKEILEETRKKIEALDDLEKYLKHDIQSISDSQNCLLSKPTSSFNFDSCETHRKE